MPAEFYPGTAVKAQDLNDNFFVLKSAIEEASCSILRNQASSDERFWNKVEDTITEDEQTTGKADALLDDDHIFTAAAIAARHDSYVQDNTPTAITHEQSGKIWNDTDDLQDYFWDGVNKTWVSFTKSGPPGKTGGFGPPGRVITSDSPPTKYPAVGDNEERDLEDGDLWLDTYHVLLYVYYVDDVGPGQWVSTTKTGPQGPEGEKGDDGIDGIDGTGVKLLGTKATVADLPATGNERGDMWIVLEDGDGYAWDGNEWDNVGKIQGPPGKGWTGGSYNASTGIVTFTSSDGLGFSTTDLRGADGEEGEDGDDGKGWTGGSYDTNTGTVTFTSDDGLGFVTGDLRGEKGDPGVIEEAPEDPYHYVRHDAKWVNADNLYLVKDFSTLTLLP